jgi:uncharacterized LabA/DUF88 family protein
MSRAVAYVDGSNWYFKLKKLLESEQITPMVDFDLRAFLEETISPDELTGIRYYIGKIRRVRGDEKSERLYAKQQQLISFLQHQNILVQYGHLITYPDGKHHEKGVDVLLSVEMIKGALEDEYNTAYLLSSDTDLVPAVKECQKLGKEIVYVGSSVHGQSFGLTKVCDKTILLQTKDVLQYVSQNSPEDD